MLNEIKALAGLTFLIVGISSYLTHIGWWVLLVMNDKMNSVGDGVIAILGTVFPPIGMVHGISLWF